MKAEKPFLQQKRKANMKTSTEAQIRFDAIEQLRNELRPTKSYQVKPTPTGKTFFDEANGGSVTINGHQVSIKYFYNASKHDMKQTENFARQLENQFNEELEHEHN
jgi:hypothetical protein